MDRRVKQKVEEGQQKVERCGAARGGYGWWMLGSRRIWPGHLSPWAAHGHCLYSTASTGRAQDGWKGAHCYSYTEHTDNFLQQLLPGTERGKMQALPACRFSGKLGGYHGKKVLNSKTCSFSVHSSALLQSEGSCVSWPLLLCRSIAQLSGWS